MPLSGVTYKVISGSGTVTASTDPPGFCFHAPTNITAPETDTILITDGTFSTTVTVSVTPVAAGGRWGTLNDPPPYQPVVSPQGTVVVTDPTGATSTFPWVVSGSGEAYGGSNATVYPGQSASVAVSGSAAFAFTWVPDASGASPPSTSVFLFSAYASADYILAGSSSADDGLGDQEQDGLGDSIPPQQEATSQGVHLKSVISSSGTATITVSSLKTTAQCAPPGDAPYGGYTFGAGASVMLPQPVDLDVSVASPQSGAIVPAGHDVTITASASPLAGNNSLCPLQSLTVKAQGGSGGDPAPLSFDAASGSATFLLSSPSTGTYTLVAKAMYDDSSGTPTEVDSAPSTFTVGSFTVKTNSWNPNPASVGQIISGQVQGAFDPSSIGGGGPTFVLYTWTTAGVWYSQDGTPGTFEPCGNYAIGWRQGQASTTFEAQFFAPGQYLLEVACTATVYSQSDGSVVASFTGTGYVGGSASDIDTGGGSGGQAHKAQGKVAQGLKAHAGGGGGITVLAATVTFDTTSVKLGIGSLSHYFTTIGVTVNPSDQIGSVKFGAINPLGLPSNEVLVIPTNENLSTGALTLDITASEPTPGSTGGSPDCTIVATAPSFAGPETVASATAIVYIPTRVGTPHDPAVPTQYEVSATPVFRTATSTPPLGIIGDGNGGIINVPYGEGFCFWSYTTPTTIIVWDQFNHPLDSMYDGAPVFEGSVNINQTISGGKYTDPVGSGTSVVLSGQTGPLNPNNAADEAQILNFLNHGTIPLPLDIGSISGDPDPVIINHILLNPGIVGRTINIINDDTFVISWP